MEFQERTPSELRWWELVIFSVILILLSTVVFVLHVDKIAAERETVFMPFNVAISLNHKKVWIVVVIIGLVLCSAWMAWRSYRVRFGRQFWRILFCMTLCIGIVVQITGKQYGVLLDSQVLALMADVSLWMGRQSFIFVGKWILLDHLNVRSSIL